MRVYQGMESARNGGVSKIGTLCNQMVHHSYEKMGLRVIPEHKLVENVNVELSTSSSQTSQPMCQ